MVSTNWKTLLRAHRQENPQDKGRLDLHDVRVKPITLTHAGYAAFPEENEYAQPKKDQSEDLFILASNTGERTTIEVYFKRRPEPILGRFEAAKDKVDVKFRLRDDQGNVYSMDETSIVEFNPNEYRGCGFAYEPLQSNRIGRIKYRGYLVKNGDASQLVYVRIRFLVLYFSKIVDHQRAFDDSCLLKQLKDCKEHVDSFTDVLEDKLEQFCQIKGTLNVEGEPERELFFLGTVGRRFLPKKPTLHPRTVFKMCGFDVEGTGFQVGCIAHGKINYFYALASKRGENFRVLKDTGTISKMTIDGLKNGEKTEFECKLTKGETTGENVKIEVEALEEEEGPWRKVKVNGVNGMAFIEERAFEETETIREVSRSCGHELTDTLVVSLDEDCAQVPDLTGGKGASLAQLKKLSQGKQWTVPNAVVVTCSAFKVQTDAMSEFQLKLQDLESKVINEQDVEKSCKEFVDWFASSSLNEKVETELKSKMEAEFGSEWETLLLAVRSSASGEDSGEMSAAGQMTTYLGLSGARALSRAVVSCWASQFAFVPVTYKRGYGQPIAAPMAVVVQRIVDCQAAGVIFTARPTDDERVLTVSANFGLGESVVSAAAEPDNFTLAVDIQANSYQVRRSIKAISEKTLGKKALVTRLNKDTEKITELDQGTVNQQIVDGPTVQSIDDSDLLRLGAIALEIAAHYGTPRDLEFGLKEGVFHLFQSRPITNLDGSFTNYELMHELDSAHLHERELYTRNHWGEIYQGASSWVATFYFSTEYIMAKMMVEDGALQPTDYNPYRAAFGQLCNQVMLNLGSDFPMSFFRKYPESDTARAFVLAFFGREITDPEVLSCIQKPAKPAPKMSLRMKLQMGGMMWTAMSAKKKIAQLKREVILENKGDMSGAMEAVPLEGKLPFAFEAMVESFFTGSLFHMGTLAGSVIKSGILLKALKKEGVDGRIAEADHNLLLSHCTDVVSAEIPNRLREIAKSIENKEVFISLSDEEALQVLKGESGEEVKAVEMFEDFLRHHGHRGHRESDPLYLPLRRNPLPGVQVIKALLQSKASLEPAEPKSIDQLLGELQTPLGSLKKTFIKRWALRWCRNAVGYRENTKSIGMVSLNQMREAMWTIARTMHRRGLIPEVELFFYLKLDEIQQIIDGERRPVFLWKAKQRRRLFPGMDRLRFDEYVKGFRMAPRPPQSQVIQAVEGAIVLKGTAVTVGTVKGRVCVAETIAEASQIRPGDILLTYSTDIGWTPYFPLISAIVTEIGGTISHGAVIAREFGIPCLIAVDGACGRFRTGDWAFIDCAMGTIAKVKEE